jgi:hypothetical protein
MEQGFPWPEAILERSTGLAVATVTLPPSNAVPLTGGLKVHNFGQVHARYVADAGTGGRRSPRCGHRVEPSASSVT